MIDADFLAAMPNGSSFINTARGRLVNEDDLIAELQKNRISAFLDVTDPEPPLADSPFYSLPNCIPDPASSGF